MSRLDELIQELCPNGVEEKRLGDIATVSRGGNFQKKDYVEDGVPCIHYGQIYTQYGLFIDKTISFISKEKAKKQKFAVKNDVVMAVTSENIDDVCKCVAWLGDEAVAISGHTAIIHHTINPKYLVYYLHSTMFYKQKTKLAHGTKVIEVTPDKLLDITLPVPPLEVQSEIVRILDNFTELTAELTARKKQYEYYRNKLLSFSVLNKSGGVILFKKLREIAEYSHKRINAAAMKKANYVGVDNLLQNRAGKVGSNYVPTKGNLTAYVVGDVLIGNIRPYLKKIWLAYNEGGASGDVLVIHLTDQSVDVKYLYHVLADDKFFNYNMQFAKGAKMPRGSKQKIRRLYI